MRLNRKGEILEVKVALLESVEVVLTSSSCQHDGERATSVGFGYVGLITKLDEQHELAVEFIGGGYAAIFTVVGICIEKIVYIAASRESCAASVPERVFGLVLVEHRFFISAVL